MKVLAIYAVNDHMNQLLLDARQARLAREAHARPSLLSRIAGAARSAVVRLTPEATPAAA
jgi:hypothetical protein